MCRYYRPLESQLYGDVQRFLIVLVGDLAEVRISGSDRNALDPHKGNKQIYETWLRTSSWKSASALPITSQQFA